jgi:hypothetical protein
MAVKPSILFGNPPTTGIKIVGLEKPKEIKPLFGTKIKQLDVPIDEFRKFSQNEAALKEARNIVLTTNVDNLRLDYVLDIGKDIQETHTSIIEKILSLSGDTRVVSTKGIIAEILETLEGAGEKRWFKKETPFGVTKKAIEVLLLRIKPQSKVVADVIDEVKGLIITAKELYSKLEAYVVAVAFFSEYKKENFPNELFTSRLGSLIATQQTIAINIKQLESIKEIAVNLIDTINNIVLTELPIWITSYVTASLSKITDPSSENQKNNIINKIKSQL